MNLSTLILCIACLALVSPSIAQEKPSKPAAVEPEKEKAAKPLIMLKPGDPLTIEILKPASEAPNINSNYTISAKGEIKMPRLETPIQAAGLTHEDLARQLETAYRSAGIFKEPSFRVSGPKDSGCEHIIAVSGQVQGGGREVPLRDGMTLYQAIMAAGGFTEFAKATRVKLIRGKKETIYDLRKLLPDGSNNPVLKDGDVIHVPQ